MEFTRKQTIRIAAWLLLTAAITQALYTALYVAEISPPRQLLWGLESLLFTVLAAFAGAAMLQTARHQLLWSAIAVSAIFNLVQVSIGVTMFEPFRAVAGELEQLKPAAGSVVALSFMIYYAAKLLLGFAALIIGLERSDILGKATAALGAIALVSNAILMLLGRDGFLPSPVAGGSGVIATLLLAVCLLQLQSTDEQAQNAD